MSSYYKKQCIAGTSQCDINGRWKLSALFEAMQNTANAHCRELHIGRDELSAMGLTWVLFRIEVRIDSYPRLDETVTVQTFTKGSRMKFCPRYYSMTDEAGRQICKAGSLWMLMEKETRKTVSPKERGIEIPENTGLEIPLKISMASAKSADEGRLFTVNPVYTDVDYNGHVNNVRYTDWLCNSFGLDEMRKKEISALSIEYNYEVPQGIALQNRLAVKGYDFRFTGTAEGKQFFRINGTLRERAICHQ